MKPSLTPEAMRVKIAEVRGWTAHQNCGSLGGYIARSPAGESFYYATSPTKDLAIRASCPDYCADLNACHEMVASLPKDRVAEYHSQLYVLCGGMSGAIEATAEQRCRAFIATLGLADGTEGEK